MALTLVLYDCAAADFSEAVELLSMEAAVVSMIH